MWAFIKASNDVILNLMEERVCIGHPDTVDPNCLFSNMLDVYLIYIKNIAKKKENLGAIDWCCSRYGNTSYFSPAGVGKEALCSALASSCGCLCWIPIGCGGKVGRHGGLENVHVLRGMEAFVSGLLSPHYERQNEVSAKWFTYIYI